MKMFKFLVTMSVLLTVASAVVAQSQPSQKPTEQSGPAMMMCPMMNKNAGQPMMGNKKDNDEGNAAAHGEHVFSLGGGNLRPAD